MTRPKKPIDNLPRVFRGGSRYLSSATNVRAAYRNDNTPTGRLLNIGFRCALRGREPLEVTP